MQASLKSNASLLAKTVPPVAKNDLFITYEDLKQDILRLYNAYRNPIEFKENYLLENIEMITRLQKFLKIMSLMINTL